MAMPYYRGMAISIEQEQSERLSWLRSQLDRIAALYPTNNPLSMTFGPWAEFAGTYVPWEKCIYISTTIPLLKSISAIVLLHEYRHALQDDEGWFTKAKIKAYKCRKRYYITVESDADRWAMEMYQKLYAAELAGEDEWVDGYANSRKDHLFIVKSNLDRRKNVAFSHIPRRSCIGS